MMRLLIDWLLAWLPLPHTRCFGLRRVLLRRAGISLGDRVWVCGGCRVYGRGELSIGAGTWLSPDTKFHTRRGAAITIGAGCDIGPDCLILTGSHEIGERGARAGQTTTSAVVIGDGCWIGARSTILPGVSIGAGSVIAAGSVVTSDVAENTLVGGVPARLIRALD
ncbi:acyltransferase [Novosphingobium colocasiae]|uniref:Transferase n=1 Tax=Novosphingobium colocasiae TaxID=1256513 RepID=A0A918PEE1_9SPHN|nr:acyltransferase [Novosphingobium colocasiae]GGZ02039.1 transferase [Novosphingobium colocasiae]